MDVDDQLLITVPQMARRLSIGTTQAWALVGREIPAIRIGRSTRVEKELVDEWARARASLRPAERT